MVFTMVFTIKYRGFLGFPVKKIPSSSSVATHPWHQAMKGATPQTAPLSLGMNQALGSQAQAAQANLPPDRRRADTGRS